MFSIGCEKGELIAEFADETGDEFVARVWPPDRLLIEGVSDPKDMSLDRQTAGRLGRLLLLFERDGNLSGATAIFDEGPAPPVAADIRDKVADIEAAVAANERGRAVMSARIGDLQVRLATIEDRLNAAASDREAVIASTELRLLAAEQAIGSASGQITQLIELGCTTAKGVADLVALLQVPTVARRLNAPPVWMGHSRPATKQNGHIPE